ncbi:hypothetical protein EH244_28640 [Variovorax beijingensis]|uniref:Translation elongation factor EFTu/EF1A C-terminal domain-containing protein n=1 Tax=Variovorax beijingensis TaxID=2496117 RepID=A0A3P3E542_9BURK|nr:hypothetical protein [Variovorax beijingensis]RRH81603.1 hypothetical protein EH244_28640 [Variovorax beijingensis]
MPIAIIDFFDSNNGGRITPPYSGFRPKINVGGIHTSCFVESKEGEEVFNFGLKHKVSLRLIFPEIHTKTFVVGEDVELFEGSKLVGKGVIVDV